MHILQFFLYSIFLKMLFLPSFEGFLRLVALCSRDALLSYLMSSKEEFCTFTAL